jgi:hypothetical protein
MSPLMLLLKKPLPSRLKKRRLSQRLPSKKRVAKKQLLTPMPKLRAPEENYYESLFT